MKVLIVEDDGDLREILCMSLKARGLNVDSCSSVQSALEHDFNTHDLFIIDVILPDGNGFELVKLIRSQNKITPILFMSTQHEIDTILNAYDAGCLDYIKKPINPKELQAKVTNILRLNQHLSITPKLVYDFSTTTLHHDGEPIVLSPKETRLVHVLMKNEGNILPWDIVKEYVWETKQHVSDETLRNLIARIRKKCSHDFIKIHKGLGCSLLREK